MAKTVFITGASSGIGEEFARQYHARGCNLILLARREDKLREIASKLNSIRENSVVFSVVDLESSSVEDIKSIVQNKNIDILINNAGRGSFGYFDKLDIESELKLVELNISATLKVLHAIVPKFKEQGSGTVVSLSSISAYQPIPYMATYAATKAFNLWHSLALREELRPYGINVVTICPGPTATEFGTAAKVPSGRIAFDSVKVSQVVRESISAIDRNSAEFVPTLKARLMARLLSVVPRAVSTRIACRLMRAGL